MAAAASGVLIAYLLVVYYVFPVDPDVVTPAVPEVVGVKFDEAERKLLEAGFAVTRGEVRNVKGMAAGVVVEQIPRGGTRQPAGTKVTLHMNASSR
jgi:beta-lactam-binding protein with PASTA domain